MTRRTRRPAGTRLRALWLTAAAFGFLLVLAPPARGAVSGGCTGRAVIEGRTYTPANDTASNPVILPKKRGVIVEWRGRQPPITKHHGALAVEIGPGSVTVATWAHPNEGKATKAKGTYSLDQAYEKIGDVVGLFRVTGFHEGAGGRCDGFAMVKIEGNPLTTPVGGAAAGLTLVSAGGLVAAAMTRKGIG